MDVKDCRILLKDGTWKTSGLHELKVGDQFKVNQNMDGDELTVNIDPEWALDGADFVYTVSSIKKETL